MTVIDFLKKYVIHHFWLGVIMIIEAVVLFFHEILLSGFIYLVFGIFFVIDDIFAETKERSVMKYLPSKIQEPNVLKLIGIIVFIIVQKVFLSEKPVYKFKPETNFM